MTITFASLMIDTEAERNGRWEDYPDWPGVAFKVRGIESEAYRRRASEIRATVAKMSPEAGGKYHETETPRNVVDNLLLDWRGFDMPFRGDETRRELVKPEYRLFIGAIVYCAAKVSAPGTIEVKKQDEPKPQAAPAPKRRNKPAAP
ncbi:hypothetical protein BTR14_20540 [Rhizobium rhizosphaerae]|uniref:Uncharacterized protein n=1 Tax=Xaviernesmea rhizosphaerae TaxID=1672749 RepID=A0ABX3P7Z5_9HYPH|nr:hypothetical protein [Xaviernesmea rhizosphaerae]OQP84193.1 hypothetical protein BTR14_20540 [Xaviernesmea rhizosphaerae]